MEIYSFILSFYPAHNGKIKVQQQNKAVAFGGSLLIFRRITLIFPRVRHFCFLSFFISTQK